jgi:hypothetical protein
MCKYLLLLLLSPLVVADDSCPYQQGAAIVGVATDSNDKVFLYCEYHFFTNQNGNAIDSVASLDDIAFSTVEYRDINQQLIAKKTADFSKSRLAPAIDQVDFRHNEKVFIQQQVISDESQKATLEVRYHEPGSGNITKEVMALKDATVVDAGFDNAIRVYWDDILSKKKVILDFVAPVQQTSIALSVKKQSLPRCQKLSDAVYVEEQHLCIKVKAANVFLNWLVKPIYLDYERSAKRLQTFSGHVNITDNKGEGQEATIKYYYQ